MIVAGSQLCAHVFPELLRPFSKSHLLFNATVLLLPFAGLGLGLSIPPNSDVPALAPRAPPKGLGGFKDPNDDLRAPFIALCSNGLAAGENGEPSPPSAPLPPLPPFPAPFIGLPIGELEKLRLPVEPDSEGVREYRGGVL